MEYDKPPRLSLDLGVVAADRLYLSTPEVNSKILLFASKLMVMLEKGGAGAHRWVEVVRIRVQMGDKLLSAKAICTLIVQPPHGEKIRAIAGFVPGDGVREQGAFHVLINSVVQELSSRELEAATAAQNMSTALKGLQKEI